MSREIVQQNEALNYNYGEVVTPFQQRLQAWDGEIGCYRDTAYKYRKLTFLLLAVSLGLSLFVLSKIVTPLITVWVVQISENGFVRSVNQLNTRYKIPSLAKANFIENFLKHALLDKNLLATHAGKVKFSPQVLSAIKALQKIANSLQNPKLHILLVREVNASDIFEVHWRLEGLDVDNQLKKHRFHGIIGLERFIQKPMKNAKQNPFDLLVDTFTWVNSGQAQGNQR